MNLNELIGAISTGEMDDSLGKIAQAVSDRRKAKNVDLKRKLRVGDVVEFNNQCGSADLIGRLAEITSIHRTRVTTRLMGDDVGKWSASRPITVPAHHPDLEGGQATQNPFHPATPETLVRQSVSRCV